MDIKLDNILGPEGVLGHLGHVRTAQEYLAVQSSYLQEQRLHGGPHGAPHATNVNARMKVYVNEGRLLIDCVCQNGVVVDAWLELACCFHCGAIYRGAQLVFPSEQDLKELDTLLAKRPTQNRHFRPGVESLADLRRENSERGLV